MVTQRLTMSAVSNTHKLNGNLIVNANATAHLAATNAAGTITQSKTFSHTNPHQSHQHHHQHHHQQQQQQQQHQQHHQQLQIQNPTSSLQQQQHQSTNLKSSAAIGLSKLQAPQQHQRRSLIPSATLQQQQQQQSSITVSTSTASSAPATTQPPQANQLQTVATVHQPSTQPQLNSAVQSSAGITQTQTTATTTLTGGATTTEQLTNPATRRSFYHLQSLKPSANPKAPAHSIPPRYQPPPQPTQSNCQQQQQQQHQHTGILKNLNSQRLSNGTKSNGNGYTSYFSETSGGNHHLGNLKYPPEIPQLSSVFIPDSLKNSTSTSRYLQQKQQHQANQNQLQHRLRSINQAAAAAASTNGIATHNNILNGHQSSSSPSDTQQQQQDMLKFVRKSDQDHPSPNASVTSSGTGGIPSTTGRLTAEQNRQLQSLINELRALKEQNQRLMDDNQELRDLCCFLDDDRQKGRKLAREWQRFGRYTASVMRQEVAAYQNKLRQLDDKQQELITDNLELKELCLYLDEERAHIAANSLCVNCGTSTRVLRDDGDGSSSSTNADENITALRNYERQLPDLHLRSTLQDQTLQYVRSLERRIQQLEEERLNTNNTNTATNNASATNLVSQQQQQHHHPPQQQHHHQQQQPQKQKIQLQQHQQPTNVATTVSTTNHQNQKIIATQTSSSSSSSPSALNDGLVDPISGRPEAVVRALQVLEVREQLERDRLGNLTGHAIDQMDDGEKALVREMCNVVWRKLEGSPNGPTALEPL